MVLSSPFPEIHPRPVKPQVHIFPRLALKADEVFSAILLGFVSTVSQIILIRELVTIFYGNELIYIIGLAGWLFWFGIGVWQAIFPDYVKSIRQALLTLWVLLAIFLPVTVLAIRMVTGILGLEVGEKAGIVEMSLISFLIVAPVSLILGQIFSFLCRWIQNRSRSLKLMGEMCWVQAFGGAVGGIFFSFIFNHRFTDLITGWGLSFLSVAACWCILKTKRSFPIIIGIIVLLTCLGLWAIPRLESFSQQGQWRDWKVLATTDSFYGNLTLVKQADEYRLFENGLRSYSTVNDLAVKENIYFALLAHPHLQRVLLIGHGLNGELREILKHPETDVDYLEINPQVLTLARKNLPASIQLNLDNVRVRTIDEEARVFLKSALERYDVIILNVGDPQSVFANRYYTREFFQEAYLALRAGGVVSFAILSDFSDPGNKIVLQSLNTTLGRVFPHVHFIPGHNSVFLAQKSDSADFQKIDKAEATLSPGDLNTDVHPAAFLYLRSMNFRDSGLKQLMVGFQNFKAVILILPLVLFLIGYSLQQRQKPQTVLLSVIMAGFTQIIFQILTILIFQILFGNAYERFAWIVTAFLVGIAGGNWRARNLMAAPGGPSAKIYQNVQSGLIIFPWLLPLSLFLAPWIVNSREWVVLFTILVLLIPFALGWLTGFQQILAMHYFNKQQPAKTAPAKQASLLFIVSVFGATVGALLAGCFLLPFYGIAGTTALCVSLNIAIWILLKGFFDLKVSPA